MFFILCDPNTNHHNTIDCHLSKKKKVKSRSNLLGFRFFLGFFFKQRMCTVPLLQQEINTKCNNQVLENAASFEREKQKNNGDDMVSVSMMAQQSSVVVLTVDSRSSSSRCSRCGWTTPPSGTRAAAAATTTP
mmetsp:Transcript_52681/g.127729  ORF Transcript_52681/g.127729 Transcript_52681/m.127729 type:complete len:133 (-) Transcript_52681:27-425(-)